MPGQSVGKTAARHHRHAARCGWTTGQRRHSNRPRPMIHSRSPAERKSSSSVKWVTTWRRLQDFGTRVMSLPQNAAARPERLDHAAQRLAQVLERIGLGGEAGERRDLDEHVGMARQRIDALDRGQRLCVDGRARKAHVIDDDPQLGMARGDLADLREPFGRVHHDRNVVPLGLRPEPVGGAVGEPRPVGVAVEGQPHAEHAGLLAPSCDQDRASASVFSGKRPITAKRPGYFCTASNA